MGNLTLDVDSNDILSNQGVPISVCTTAVIKVKNEAQVTFTDNTAGAEAMSKEDGINGIKITLVSGLGSVRKI